MLPMLGDYSYRLDLGALQVALYAGLPWCIMAQMGSGSTGQWQIWPVIERALTVTENRTHRLRAARSAALRCSSFWASKTPCARGARPPASSLATAAFSLSCRADPKLSWHSDAGYYTAMQEKAWCTKSKRTGTQSCRVKVTTDASTPCFGGSRACA